MDAVRDGLHKRFQEGHGRLHVGFFDEFDHGGLRGPAEGYEEVGLAFSGPYLGEVDVEEAGRTGVGLLPPGLVAFGFGQPADAVPFQTTVGRGARELRDGGLEGIEAVVERQRRVLAKGDNDSFLLDRKDSRSGKGWPRATIGSGLALLPFGDGRRADAMPPRQRPHALLAMLYRAPGPWCRAASAVVALRCRACPIMPPSDHQKSMRHPMPGINTLEPV